MNKTLIALEQVLLSSEDRLQGFKDFFGFPNTNFLKAFLGSLQGDLMESTSAEEKQVIRAFRECAKSILYGGDTSLQGDNLYEMCSKEHISERQTIYDVIKNEHRYKTQQDIHIGGYVDGVLQISAGPDLKDIVANKVTVFDRRMNLDTLKHLLDAAISDANTTGSSSPMINMIHMKSIILSDLLLEKPRLYSALVDCSSIPEFRASSLRSSGYNVDSRLVTDEFGITMFEEVYTC